MKHKTENANFTFAAEAEIQFVDIFDLAEIQQMQDLFAEATGVASIITLPNGKPITRPSNFCRFCEIIRSTKKGLANCIKSDMTVGDAGQISSEFLLKPCLSAGLWDTGASIVVDGIHLANWLIGQVRNPELEEANVLEYALEIGADVDELKCAFLDVTVMTPAKFRKVSEMLIVYANDLSLKAYHIHQLKIEIEKSKRANELLHESEESLSITLQSIGDGVISTDKVGNVLNMNQVAEKLCGWTLSDAKGKKLTEVFKIVNSYTRAIVADPVAKVLESGQIVGLANHTVLISKHGVESHIADSAAPIRNKNGEILGVVLVFSDVTESFLAEEKIRKSELRYRGLMNTLEAGVVVHAVDTSIILSNPKACELLGMTEDELRGKTGTDKNWEFIDDDNLPLPEGDFPVNIIVRTKEPLLSFVAGIYHSETAETVWVELTGFPVKDSNDEVIEVVISFIDITNRRKIEKELQDSERYLKDTQQIAQLGTYTMDINSNRWSSSHMLNNILGIDDDYTKTMETWAEIIHPDWQQLMLDYFQSDVVKQKSKFDKVYKIIRKNDLQERWVHGFGALVFDDEGSPILMIGTIQDITDMKRAEEALTISEAKYRTIFENVQDVYYQIDNNGYVIELSPSVSYYTGYSRDKLIGKPVLDLYFEPTAREKFLLQINRTGIIRDYELDIKDSDNKILHVSINAQVVFDGDRNPIYIEGFLRDITKRKKAEYLLKASESKFRDYIQFAPHAVFVADEAGNYIEANPAASRMTGYSQAELLTIDQSKLVSADSFERFVAHFENVKQKGYALDEFLLIRKDSQKIFISVDTVKISNNLFLGFVVDITDRKKAQEILKENEQFLIETQRIAQLGNCTIDLASKTWRSSEVLNTIFGIDVNFDNSYKGWQKTIHPDFEEGVLEYFLNDVIKNKIHFDSKFKIIRQTDGEIRWVQAVGKLKFDLEGKPTQLIVTIQDVTERKQATEALRESEALYRTTLNASPDSVIILEMDGSIRMVSPSFLTLCHFDDESKVKGRNLFEFLVPEDQMIAQSNTIFMFQGYMGTVVYRMVRTNGEIFHAEIKGDIIWSDDGVATGMVYIIRDISGRIKIEHDLKRSQDQLKNFAAHLQNVREEERVMLAREIHDELGQILIAIKIDLGMLRQKVSKVVSETEAEHIQPNFDDLFGLVDNTINTTRKIMTDLRPEVLDLVGFVDAAKLHILNFQQRCKISCTFENKVNDLVLNSEQSVALYRILQESLSNIARHSKATTVIVQLSYMSGKLKLEVDDNGIGFDVKQKSKLESYGLIGIRERTYLLDGEFVINSQLGVGTSLKIIMPYNLLIKN
jgi:PAS domain S-box-containing protein